jgi:hypothetical protein
MMTTLNRNEKHLKPLSLGVFLAVYTTVMRFVSVLLCKHRKLKIRRQIEQFGFDLDAWD